jgi:hypothetical protein
MDELNKILNDLIDVYNENYDNDVLHEKASELWTKYYTLSKKLGIKSYLAYNLYLLLESDSYIINQKPIRRNVSNEEILSSLSHWDEVLNNNRKGISMDDAINLLDWTVENTRRNLENICVDVNNSSLNGYCDVTQASSLMPLKEKGFSITKNSCSKSFGYPFNHYFGTVTIPIEEGGDVSNKTFLIDITYRQFFSTVRCNYGRYFTEEENTHIKTAPDPGFFVEDKDFAKELMGRGYILLDKNSAKKYGEPFYLSSLDYDSIKNFNNIKDDNYFDLILNSSFNNYIISEDSLEGFNLSFPSDKLIK